MGAGKWSDRPWICAAFYQKGATLVMLEYAKGRTAVQ